MKRVVITGIGALTPIGNTADEYKAGLENGVSGAAMITHFDPEHFKTKFACEVKGLDMKDRLEHKEIRRMDRFAQLGLAATAEAMEDSGLDLDKINLDRAGVIWGSGIGGLGSLELDVEAHTLGSGVPRYSPFMIPKMIPDIAPGQISIKYGLRGVNYSTVSACASSTHAIINSTDYIRLGKADVIVTGGSESVVLKPGIGGFNAMKALSTRNDSPETASRPFDKDRDGFVLGEGAGVLILEEYEHAKARGAKIYGEVVGTGMTADAYHLTAPHPEGLGAANVISMAMKEAGLSSTELDYINVHGTSTPLGDIAELRAIHKVFGDDAFNLDISSTKSMTGHLLGAAGAIEAIAGVLAMNHDFIPPTINHFTDDPEIDGRFRLTFNEAKHTKVNSVLSNTFGFGGHNASVIFKSI